MSPPPPPSVAPRPGPVSPPQARRPDTESQTPALFRARMLPPLIQELERSMEFDSGLPPAIRRAGREAVGLEGSRRGSLWRPLLTLAAERACGGEDTRALGVAAAIELTHTASLVLDDLPCMDDAEERRGSPATHCSIGPAASMLLAIGLLGRSAELLAAAPRGGARLVRRWGAAFGLSGMAGGQAVDVTGAFERGGAARRLHRRKTTELSALAVWSGSVVANASSDTQARLYRFGRDLGWAYQLADDARDLDEDRDLGRGPGGRSPARQSHRLLRRSLTHLQGAGPDLDPAGIELLRHLALEIVRPPSAPAPISR